MYGYFPSDKKMMNYLTTWCGLQDHKGIIWVGCQWGGLIQLNPSTGKVAMMKPPEFEEHTIRSMLEDAEGNIWFGTQHSTLVKWQK
jgi:ligand-binding sensor domain-containing protein